MIYELVLIAAVVGGGYWGWFFVTQRPHGSATFGAMLLAASALAGVGLLGHKLDAAWLGVPGAIGLGASACLLVVGPVARVLARRAVASERMGLAIRLLDLAELLAPGSGVTEEKALVRAMSEIREGRIEPTVEALARARERAPADTRLAIDERIALLYLGADRWTDAIAHAEANLFCALPGADAAGDGSLRRALGITPPVWVDLLAAYGRTGDLEQAARMLIRLEDVCAGRDDAALWLHRGRMIFLALAGRIEAVRALVAPSQSRHMSSAARTYWIAVAHEHGGDRAAAAIAYGKARARSRGRLRELSDRGLAGLAGTRRAELAAVASEVVARVEAAPLPPQIEIARTRWRATWLLAAIVVGVSLITARCAGDTADFGVMVRAGALARGMVAAGEWWRMISCVFVHAGPTHLVVNAIGLVVLGLLVEDVFGAARMVAIFAVAGVSGAAASYLASPVGISAGASGAVFGLLAALLVEMTWHRRYYPLAWKRGLWGALIVVAVAELGYGYLSDMTDQWAHGGGLFAGAVMGAALSPTARWVRIGSAAGRAIAIGFGVLAVVAGVLAARTSLADSLARGGFARRTVAGIAIHVPVGWEAWTGMEIEASRVRLVGLVSEPDGAIGMILEPGRRTAPGDLVERLLARQAQRAKDPANPAPPDELDLGRIEPASEPLIALPPGWDGSELVTMHRDAIDYDQRGRAVLCRRVLGDQSIFVIIQVPETIASAAPEFVALLLASIGPA